MDGDEARELALELVGMVQEHGVKLVYIMFAKDDHVVVADSGEERWLEWVGRELEVRKREVRQREAERN